MGVRLQGSCSTGGAKQDIYTMQTRGPTPRQLDEQDNYGVLSTDRPCAWHARWGRALASQNAVQQVSTCEIDLQQLLTVF